MLGLHADYAHISNGQGLGPINPSFDGIGVGLDLAVAFAAIDVAADAAWDADRIDAVPWVSAIAVEGTFGHVGDAWLGSGRVRLASTITDHLAAQLDTELAELAANRALEVGLDLIGTWQRATLGAHLGYRNYAGIDTGVVQLQIETQLTRGTSAIATGVWEPSSYIGSVHGAAGLRLVPIAGLAVDAGLGVSRASEPGSDATHAVYFAAEWQLPVTLATERWSVFVERRLSGVAEIGLRFTYGGATMRSGSVPLWRRLR